MNNRYRHIVLVSGAPGAGKTTIARALADRLRFALVTKDDLKESLFDALQGPVGDLAFSRKIGAASMELLWVLAKRCPQVILEANFRPGSKIERERMKVLSGEIVEVHCSCPAEECVRRYNARAESGLRHRAHIGKATLEMMSEYVTPVGIGDLIDVDTSDVVDIEAIALRIRRVFDR